MNRKWNLFSRKKEKKADSHGTTLANEEMFFQASVRPGNKWTTTTMKSSTEQSEEIKSKPLQKQPSSSHVADQAEKTPSECHGQKPLNNKHPTTAAEPQLPLQKIEQMKVSHHPNSHKTVVTDPSMLSDASVPVPRISPRIARKLIKPGAPNNLQPAYLVPPLTTSAVLQLLKLIYASNCSIFIFDIVNDIYASTIIKCINSKICGQVVIAAYWFKTLLLAQEV